MTSAEQYVIYPRYCFHLSPTDKWCPFRAADIQTLKERRVNEGQDVFFYLNYPIRWVRVVGVVVAIDEFYGRRVYTIDDSTGLCVECSLDLPKPLKPPKPGVKGGAGDQQVMATAATDQEAPEAPAVAPDIDVGIVVEVRGSLKAFRGQNQVTVLKLQRVRSSDHEVQFWNKIRTFRNDVLSKPWVLDDREVRRCKKLHKADQEAQRKLEAAKRKRLLKNNNQTHSHQKHLGDKSSSSRPAHAQKPLEGTVPQKKGQYSALGL